MTGTPWARGHQRNTTCITCEDPANRKPPGDCTEEQHHAYYARQLERNNARRRRVRAEARAAGTVYRAGRGNPETSKERQRAELEQRRDTLFARLGGAVCVRCGFSDKRALQFDHIDGGGRAHRKAIAGGGTGYFRALVKMPVEQLRSTFQVLCANCNTIKRIEEGEHHAPTTTAVAA